MGRKCTVINCKTGYESEKDKDHIVVYGFPSDPEECRKWVASLPNQVKPTKYVGVCARHWPADVHKIMRGRYLVPAMPPSINFGDINISNKPTAYTATPRSTKKASSAARRVPEIDPLHVFKEKNSFQPRTLRKQLRQTLKSYGIAACNKDKTHQTLLSPERNGCIHTFSVYFIVTETNEGNIAIEFEGFKGLKQIRHPSFGKQIVTSWDQLEAVLHFFTGQAASEQHGLPAYDQTKKPEVRFGFVERQIELDNSPRNSQVYSIKDLTLAFSWFVRSRALYVELRKHLILPSLSTLKRITRIAKNTGDQKLFKKIFDNMEEQNRACMVIIDEVYVKSGVSYSGGQIFGLSKDNPDEPAKTLLTIMVKCCHSRQKFIAKMIPVNKLNSQFMYDCVVDTISLLQDSGARVLCIINDNNKVNQKFFSLFNCYNNESPWIVRNPADPRKPMFLIYDPVHILKNIRNNFIQEKTKTLEFLDPETDKKIIAKWSDVEELYKHEESNMDLLYLSKLTKASVYPTNLERQKVQLVLNVFCDETASALKTCSISTPSMKATAQALLLVIRLFKVLNVKSDFTAQRLNDPNRVALDLTESGAGGFKILTDWVKIASFMTPASSVRCRELTRDTSGAIKWTCESLQCLAHYLLTTNEAFKLKKVCLGVFTQDDLERHFGYFRMACGSTYHITVQDIFATHNIDRARLMLKNVDELDTKMSSHMCADCFRPTTVEEQCVISEMKTNGVEGKISRDEEMAVYMLAGYIAFKCPNLRGTSALPFEMTVYFDDINRGKLSRPCDSLLHLVLLSVNFFKASNTGHCRTRLAHIFSTFPGLFSLDVNVPTKALHRLCNCIFKRFSIKRNRDYSTFQSQRKVAKLSNTSTAVQRH